MVRFLVLRALYLVAVMLGKALVVPTALPTPLPIAGPTALVPAPGPYFYHTFHSGPECKSVVHAYAVEQYTTNTCMPPDAANPTYYRMTCKKSINWSKHSITKTTYATDDDNCDGTPLAGPRVEAHASACKPAPFGAAGYSFSECGDLPDVIRSRAQILVKSFPQAPRSGKSLRKASATASMASVAVCQGLNVITRAYVLGVCMPFKQGSGHKENTNTRGDRVSYHRKLALVSASASVIVLSETRYRASDSRCHEAPYDTVQQQFNTNADAATASCVRDPLDSTMAYMQATYYDGNSATHWAQADAFLRNRMVPTAAPTKSPTTANPTPTPTQVPTLAPTLTPTQVPTLAPTFTASVAFFDSTAWSATNALIGCIANAQAQVSLAVKITTTNAGTITHVLYYRSAIMDASRTVAVWSNSGLLSSVYHTATSSDAWQIVALATPVTLSTGVTYYAGFNGCGWNFYGVPTSAVTTGSITAQVGYYEYTISTAVIPTRIYGSGTNYLINFIATQGS